MGDTKEPRANPLRYGIFLQGPALSTLAVVKSNPLSNTRTNQDDPRLGPTGPGTKCRTCLQTVDCNTHLGVITIYPIPIPVVIQDIIPFVGCMCGSCGRIAVSPDERDNLRRANNNIVTLSMISSVISRKPDNYPCPFCKKELRVFKPVGFPVGNQLNFQQTALFYLDKPKKNDAIIKERIPFHKLPIIDNHDLWELLKNVPMEDTQLLDYRPTRYHPGLFMTDIIPIASSLIRQKSNTAAKGVGGNTKRLHTAIEDYQIAIREKLGSRRLSEARKELENRPSEFYDIVMNIFRLYYVAAMLQTSVPEVIYAMMQKELGLGSQKAVSVINMLPKKKGLLRRLAAAVRLDVIARSPLAGYTYGITGTATLPIDFAMKVTIPERVTMRNIETARALVRNGPNVYPGAKAYIRRGATFNLANMDLQEVARSLLPGDTIMRHTRTGDIALHQRYPSIREESIDASIIKVTMDNLIRLPLPTCLKKMADFDGDDTQFFFFSALAFAAEAYLLQGLVVQFIAPGDGRPAVGMVNDAIVGLNYLLARKKFTQLEANGLFSNTYTGITAPGGKSEYSTGDLIERVLPTDFYYVDPSGKIRIEGGKIISGTVGTNAFDLGKGAFLLRALAVTLDTYAAIRVLEDLTRICYMANSMFGSPFADDVRRKEPQLSKIRALVAETRDKIDKYADKFHAGKLVTPVGQDPMEYYEKMQLFVNAEHHLPKAQALVKEMLTGTTLDKVGIVDDNLSRLVLAMAARGQITHMKHRPTPRLASQTRHLVWYPRGDDSSVPSGFIHRSYLDKMWPIDHFNDGAQERLNLYEKGVGVAEQGYFNRKSSTSLGPVYMGHYGEVRGPSGSIIAYSYGHLGADPRHSVPLKIDAHLISDKEFEGRYSGVPEEYTELLAIRQDWRACIEAYSRITSDERYDPLATGVESMIDLETLLLQARARYPVEGTVKKPKKGTQAEIWGILKNMREKFIEIQHGPRAGPFVKKIISERVRAFMRIFRFICCSARFLREGWSKEEVEHAMGIMARKYLLSLCDAGDPIGMKASLNVAWPFTQIVLHATRGGKATGGGSIDLIRRSRGTKLFREQMEGTTPKNAISTFFLKGEKARNPTEAFDLAKKISSVWLKDVTLAASLVSISPDMLDATTDETMGKLKEWLKSVPDSVRKVYGQRVSSWFFYVFHLDSFALLLNKVDISQIATRLQSRFQDLIELAIPIYENEKGMYLFLNIKPTHSMEDMEAGFAMLMEKGVIHGHPKFSNGSVAIYSGKPKIEPDGKLSTDLVYRVLLNGSDIPYLLNHPDIDQTSIASSNIMETNEVLNISEAMFRCFEILSFEASTLPTHAAVLKRHLDLIVHYQSYRGNLVFIPRASMGANPDIDLIEKMIFETAGTFLTKSLHNASFHPISSSFSTSIMMGRVPKIGSGISDVLLPTSDLYKRRSGDKSKQIMAELSKGKLKKTDGKKMAFTVDKIPVPLDVVDKMVSIDTC